MPDRSVKGAVHVTRRGRWLEVRLVPRFTRADIEAVKSIPGRRWRPEDHVWVLPHAPESIDALSRFFGARLVRSGAARAPSGSADAGQGGGGEAGGESTASCPDSTKEVLHAMRRVLRTREYSWKTERAYLGWARRFLHFHSGGVHELAGLGASHAEAFLEHLATSERLAARSRNQAASALAFMFKEVLGRDEMGEVPRARGPRRMPLVLSHREVLRVLGELHGKYFLIAALLYSAGLRLEEALRIRVKDVDFELRQIMVRDGKGRKDRYAPLARRATELLRAQMARVAEQHRKDRADGHGWAPLPAALHRKDPRAGFDPGWQFVFPASTLRADPATGGIGRWPLHATAVQREVKSAVRRSGLTKPASCHTFRHSFATEALRGGCDIRTLQHVLGHKDIRTTMIYLHVVEQTGLYVRSPLDRPDDPEDSEELEDSGELEDSDDPEHDPEHDVVAGPWSSRGIQWEWELAARQWGPPHRDKPRRRKGQ